MCTRYEHTQVRCTLYDYCMYIVIVRTMYLVLCAHVQGTIYLTCTRYKVSILVYLRCTRLLEFLVIVHRTLVHTRTRYKVHIVALYYVHVLVHSIHVHRTGTMYVCTLYVHSTGTCIYPTSYTWNLEPGTFSHKFWAGSPRGLHKMWTNTTLTTHRHGMRVSIYIYICVSYLYCACVCACTCAPLRTHK